MCMYAPPRIFIVFRISWLTNSMITCVIPPKHFQLQIMKPRTIYKLWDIHGRTFFGSWPINWSWLVTAAVYFDLAAHALLLLGRGRVCSAAFVLRDVPLPLLRFLGAMFLFIQRRQLEGPSMLFLEAWKYYIDFSSTRELYEQLDDYTAILPCRHCFIIKAQTTLYGGSDRNMATSQRNASRENSSLILILAKIILTSQFML